jgi:DNA-binding NarL/FixJ family response regulator
MSGIDSINLNVVVVDRDFYARHAINAYLAWDRRTRVICKTARLEDFRAEVDNGRLKQEPDAVVLDANQLGGSRNITAAIKRLHEQFANLTVICLAPFSDLDDLYAALDAGAKAYLLKPDVRIHIAWAICHAYMLDQDGFLISAGVSGEARKLSHRRLQGSSLLASPRQYQGLTPRIRQAIELNAIEGMSHRLVAHEMGIKVSAVRDYIKQAYATLESYHDDAGDYPDDMSAQEVAFMRITALDIPDS